MNDLQISLLVYSFTVAAWNTIWIIGDYLSDENYFNRYSFEDYPAWLVIYLIIYNLSGIFSLIYAFS